MRPALVWTILAALPSIGHASEEAYRASAYVFGTLAQVTVFDHDTDAAQAAVSRVFREFDRLHRSLHAWRPGDLVALNEAIAKGERRRTTPEIAGLIRESRQLAARSDDLFNPAIGRLVALWSFHRDRPGGPVPDRRDIASAVAAHPRMSDLIVAGDAVTSSNKAVRLDFGGYAKGHALDRAAGILRASGIGDALINIGGNAMALGRRGDRPWRVGLDSPRGEGLMATLDLEDGEAVGTSGDYRRFYVVDGKRYAHIIDPRTGYPVSGVQSVTVLVSRQPAGAIEAGALSDAASKPIFIAGVAGWREAAARLGVSRALLVDSEGRMHLTRGMYGRLGGLRDGAVAELAP